MSKMYEILKVIIFTLISTLFIYLGDSNFLNMYITNLQDEDFIGRAFNIELLKAGFFSTGLLLSVTLLSFNLVITKIKNYNTSYQRENLIRYIKEMLLKTLATQTGKKSLNMNIRIFVPKKSLLGKIVKKKEFVVRNIKGLSQEGYTRNLTYEVLPERQGIVGLCYQTGYIVVEEDLQSNFHEYNLTKEQESKMRGTEFILCVPIYVEKDKIIGIISFESEEPIGIIDEIKVHWGDLTYNFSRFLYEYLPELFK